MNSIGIIFFLLNIGGYFSCWILNSFWQVLTKRQIAEFVTIVTVGGTYIPTHSGFNCKTLHILGMASG